MSFRTATWLAWSTWVFCALFTATALVIAGLGVSTGVSFVEFGAAFNTAAIAITFSTVGALVASRRSENPIGWIMCAGGLVVALGSLTDAWAVYSLFGSPEGPVPGAALSAWVSLWSTDAAIGSFSLLLLLFPDGRLPSNRWRPVVWLVALALVAESAFSALLTEQFVGYRDTSNPFYVAALGPLRDAYATYAQTPLSILAVVLPAIALVARYWRSRGVERQQLKWFVSSGALVALGSILISVVLDFFEEESFRSQLLLTVFFAFITLALCGIPISIGAAILRYHLYEIDLLINRTLVYAVLTATLVAVYFGGVAVTQAILRALVGQQEQPQLATVVSTLVIAALFNPLRQRIQWFTDRRFYRRKYDTGKTLEAFSTMLRQETDLDALSADLVGVVRETMEPAHVSLWLRSDTGAKDEQ
jgi:cytochrome b subunit of formate dehydrogenase